MTRVRRLALAVVGVASAVVFAAPTSYAAAQPPCPGPGHGSGPHGHHYPPGLCKAETSASSVAPGHTMHVSGTGFTAGETVVAALIPGDVLDSFTASATGAVTGDLTFPGSVATGHHKLVLQGTRSGQYLTAAVDVAASAAASTTQAEHSDLPFTGAAAAIPLTGAGLALVLAGGVTLMTVRRRRRPQLP